MALSLHPSSNPLRSVSAFEINFRHIPFDSYSRSQGPGRINQSFKNIVRFLTRHRSWQAARCDEGAGKLRKAIGVIILRVGLAPTHLIKNEITQIIEDRPV